MNITPGIFSEYRCYVTRAVVSKLSMEATWNGIKPEIESKHL